MDSDAVWQHIDTQRLEIAYLIDEIDSRDPAQWFTPSMCQGWTVLDVAAHLTHSSIAMPRMLLEAARSGFRFNPSSSDGRRRSSAARADIGRHSANRRVTTASAGYHSARPADRRTCARPGHLPSLSGSTAPCPATQLSRQRNGCGTWVFRSMRGTPVFRKPARRYRCGLHRGDGREIHATIRELLMLLTGRPIHLRIERSSGM